MMRKKRLSVRLPHVLVDALDVQALKQGRSRSNYVDHTLTKLLALPIERLPDLEADAPGSKARLLSFRIPEASVDKLDAAAGDSERSRSETVARLLAGSLAAGWLNRVRASQSKPRPVAASADANVFA